MSNTSPPLSDLDLRETPTGTFLKLKVAPGARRNALGGVHAGMLRVSVTVAPEKGKANRAVQAVLAEALGLPVRALELVAGETSSQKSILVHGLNATELRQRLAAHFSSASG